MGGGVNMNGQAITNVNGIAFYGGVLNLNSCNITNLGYIAGTMLPSVDQTYDLGSAYYRWRNLNLYGNLVMSNYTVITSALVLQNVTANANIINAGTFAEAQIPHTLTSAVTLNGGLTMGGGVNMNSNAITGLSGIGCDTLPTADDTYQLGNASYRWKNVYISENLVIANYTVITSGLVLQNVTAAATIITSGTFAEARIPHTFGSAVTLNGGLTMGAGLNMNANAITSVNGITFYGSNLNMNSCAIVGVTTINQCMPSSSNSGDVGSTSSYWYVVAAGSVWYKGIGSFACALELSDQPVSDPEHPWIKYRNVSQARKFVSHEMSKEWKHTPSVVQKDGSVKLKCPVCGGLSDNFCPQHQEEMEDLYTIKTGDLVHALSHLVLDLSQRVQVLEGKLKGVAS
jgi:hypothetical protein